MGWQEGSLVPHTRPHAEGRRRRGRGELLEKRPFAVELGISNGNNQGPFQPLKLTPTGLRDPVLSFPQSLGEAEPGQLARTG